VRKLSFVAAISAAVHLISAVAFAAPGHPPATFSYTEHGRAVTRAAGTLRLEAGKNLVVQTHVLEPGFRAPWHRHPDSSWVLVMRGELTVAFSCDDRQVWRAGSAYLNPPVETAVNEGSEAVELVVIYTNVPADHPAGVIPFTPEPPPAGCPK
jgi:quercetin dioxygenase-like cupin family protein